MITLGATARRFFFLPCLILATAAGAEPISLSLDDARIQIDGLGWLDRSRPELVRLPQRLAKEVRPPVWTLAHVPSGVRLRFATDSGTVSLVAKGSGAPPSPHLTAFGAAGVDLYIDGHYVGSGSPAKDGRLEKTWKVGTGRRMREIVFYLPFGKPLAVESIALEPDANVEAPAPYRFAQPVVYYGSSITQGIAASNAGLTFPALIGRDLNLDFINLGFSGNGLGETELAEAVASLEALCFVVDYWANPTPQVYRSTLPRFIETIRARHPQTPIIVTGPYFNPSEDLPGSAGDGQKEKRAFAAEFVARRRAAGDNQLQHVDGLLMIDRAHAHALADGRHPNSLGFERIARILGAKISEVTQVKR